MGGAAFEAVRGFGLPRYNVGPQDIAHILPRLCPRKGSPEAQALEAAEREEEAASQAATPVALAAADMQQLRLTQQRHARLFKQQRQRVGVLHLSTQGLNTVLPARGWGRNKNKGTPEATLIPLPSGLDVDGSKAVRGNNHAIDGRGPWWMQAGPYPWDSSRSSRVQVQRRRHQTMQMQQAWRWGGALVRRSSATRSSG